MKTAVRQVLMSSRSGLLADILGQPLLEFHLDRDDWTTVSGSSILAVRGLTKGSDLRDLSITGGLSYPATRTFYNGFPEASGGGLNARNCLSSETPSWTYVALVRLSPSGTVLNAFNAISTVITDTGASFFQAGWTTQPGVGLNATGAISRYSISDKNYHLVVYSYDGSALLIYVDGALALSQVMSQPLPRPATFVINNYTTSASLAAGTNISSLYHALYPVASSPSIIGEIDIRIRSRFQAYKSSAFMASSLWMHVGNSIGANFPNGNQNTPVVTFNQRLNSSYGKNIDKIINISKGGETTPGITASIADYIAPHLAQHTGQKDVFFHEGTNDISLNNASGSQAYSNLRTCWQSLLAAGASRVFVGTILPSKVIADQGRESARLECNALIRANSVIDGCTDYVDFEANPNLTNYADSVYFWPDGLHLRQPGTVQKGNSIADRLNTYIN
jgi:lysophospholipase L1-like esterase